MFQASAPVLFSFFFFWASVGMKNEKAKERGGENMRAACFNNNFILFYFCCFSLRFIFYPLMDPRSTTILANEKFAILSLHVICSAQHCYPAIRRSVIGPRDSIDKRGLRKDLRFDDEREERKTEMWESRRVKEFQCSLLTCLSLLFILSFLSFLSALSFLFSFSSACLSHPLFSSFSSRTRPQNM